MATEKIIYIYPKKSTFISNDLDFLQKKYTILTQELPWLNPLQLPVNLLRQCFFLLRHAKSTKAIVVNFGGYFSLLPTLFGKWFQTKTLLILNGTDCVSFPSYNYGSLRKPLLKFFIKKSYQNATKLLPVDESLINQKHTFDEKVRQKKQGFQAFFPKLKTPVAVIPNGFKTQFWNFKGTKKSGFTSVAFLHTTKNMRVKGIDLLLAAAKQFPDEHFTIVGMSALLQKDISIPKNVQILPFTEKENLRALYQKNQYYLQLSVNEGFGCALSEAMLCGCIPIVSNAGALPKLIGSSGFVVNKRSNAAVYETILKAINLSAAKKKQKAQQAHKRIADNFDISVREQLLLQELDL